MSRQVILYTTYIVCSSIEFTCTHCPAFIHKDYFKHVCFLAFPLCVDVCDALGGWRRLGGGRRAHEFRHPHGLWGVDAHHPEVGINSALWPWLLGDLQALLPPQWSLAIYAGARAATSWVGAVIEALVTAQPLGQAANMKSSLFPYCRTASSLVCLNKSREGACNSVTVEEVIVVYYSLEPECQQAAPASSLWPCATPWSRHHLLPLVAVQGHLCAVRLALRRRGVVVGDDQPVGRCMSPPPPHP